MRDNRLDLALLLEILQTRPCERAVDLQSVDEGGYCDEAVRLDIFVELLGGGLVEDDSVLGLVLDCRGGFVLVDFRGGETSHWLRECAASDFQDGYLPFPLKSLC